MYSTVLEQSSLSLCIFLLRMSAVRIITTISSAVRIITTISAHSYPHNVAKTCGVSLWGQNWCWKRGTGNVPKRERERERKRPSPRFILLFVVLLLLLLHTTSAKTFLCRGRRRQREERKGEKEVQILAVMLESRRRRNQHTTNFLLHYTSRLRKSGEIVKGEGKDNAAGVTLDQIPCGSPVDPPWS